MKKTTWLCVLALAAGLAACTEKKPSREIIVPKEEAPRPKGTQEIGNYSQSRQVPWVGAVYTVEVSRMADKSLPLVDDGAGNKYYDNTIRLRVVRRDGSEFFNRVFTKADFEACVDAPYKKNGALLGIVLDRAEGDYLYFAASVGSPDKMSDEYVPLVLRLSRMGEVSVSKDTQLDTGNSDNAPGGQAPTEQDLDEEEGV